MTTLLSPLPAVGHTPEAPHRQASSLLLLLALLPAPRRALDIAELMDIPQSELDSLLWELFQRGLARSEDSGLRWSAAPDHAALLPACLHTLRNATELGSFESVLILLHEGKSLDACILLEPQLDVLIRRSHIAGAALCMELLIARLFRWRAASATPTELHRYIDLVVALQSKSLYFGLRTRKAYSLTDGALKAAEQLTNGRAVAVLTLLKASLENFSGEFRPEQMRESIARGFDAVAALGDSDILVQAGNFIFTLHYATGEFVQAMEAFEQTLWTPRAGQAPYFREMYPLYICPGALYLGLYPYAVGLAEHSLRQAESVKYHHNIRWWHVLLGIIFLYLQHTDKALHHFAEVMDCLDMEADPKLTLWATRGMAYYHFLEGRTAVSYNLMRRCLEARQRLGYTRFSYTAPWILELLGAYDEAGFAPLPGFPLEGELDYALSGGHSPLKGMALRIQARRMELSGAPFNKVLHKYEQSLTLFHQSGDAVEHAKGQLELAAFLRRNGKHARARIMEEQGQACLRLFRREPQGLKRSPAAVDAPVDQWDGCVIPRRPAKVLTHLENILDALPPALHHRQNVQRLLYVTLRELGAERAALFHRNAAGGHLFLAGVHCEESDYDSAPLRLFVQETFEGFDSTEDMGVFSLHDGVFTLALRLDIGQGTQWGMLLESCHFAGDFACLSRPARARLSALLARRLASTEAPRPAPSEPPTTPRPLPSAHASPLLETPYGDSPGLRFVVEQARHVAGTDVPVLLLGETGVGKEVLARRIHDYSGRTGPFVAVHPASTPETLFESEFFGHEKGAFTGAEKQKPGLFEMADKGTLFVDEVGEISMLMQVKLLRVLQDKTFLRVGGVRLIASDFRLITATNRDLQQEVHSGHFREDLYYRISVMPLHLPPLRARPQDIASLARYFAETFARRYGRTIPPLTPQTLAELEAYAWPGNVRELKNVVERAVLLHREGPLHFHLGGEIRPEEAHALAAPPAGIPPLVSRPDSAALAGLTEAPSLHHDTPTMETLERRYMEHILRQTDGKITGPQGAAEILGMKRSTLYAKIREYGLAHLLPR